MSLGTAAGRHDGGIAYWETGLLTVLLDRSGQGRTITGWTHERLAGYIGCSARSVKRWLDGLRERGWVEWCHNQHRSNNGLVRQEPNSYLLLIPDWVKAKMDESGTKPRRRPRPAPPDGAAGDRVEAMARKAGGLPGDRRRAAQAAAEPIRPQLPEIAGEFSPGFDNPDVATAAKKGLAAAKDRLRGKSPP